MAVGLVSEALLLGGTVAVALATRLFQVCLNSTCVESLPHEALDCLYLGGILLVAAAVGFLFLVRSIGMPRTPPGGTAP